MYGYICFFNGKSVELYASTSYEAYKKAVEIFKVSKKNEYKISVHLAEENGKVVNQIASY